MRIRSNPHTHTSFSDGKCAPEEVVRRAIGLGFRSIGISDHSVQPFDAFFTIPAEREAEYQNTIRALADAHRDAIRVYLSVEFDAFGGVADRSEYDYLLMSAHYVERDGEYSLVDSPPNREKLFRFRDEAFSGDGVKLAVRFYEMLSEAVLRVRPDIMGHFDTIKRFNRFGALYDEASPKLHRARLDALECVCESGALLEINTGGLARGYIDEPYPSRALWRRFRELGGRAILGSDSHHPDTLNFGFDTMRDYMIEEGFSSVVELGGANEPLFVERALR
ncbi:MAG: PHP domain-containing protein [Clostridiales bacterium]|nr:PHP domain-containing protein [Clostridiales bacterium]